MSKKKWKLGATLRSRALLLAVLLLAATCSDDGNPPGSLGQVAGVAYYGGPLVGANVTVRQYYQDEETITIGTATTADDGSWSVDSGTFAGDFLVTISGGYYEEASGGRVTLDSSASLHAPIQNVQTAEKRLTVAVTPLSEVIWQLGLARLAAGQDADYPAAIEHARALVAAHVDFDPLSAQIAPISAETAFSEASRYALVLAGMSELAAIAAADQGVTVQAINTRTLLTQLVRDAASVEARLDGNGAEVLSLGANCTLASGCSMEQLGCYASCSVYVNTLRSRLGAAVLAWLRRPENRTGLDKTDVLSWVTDLKDNTDPMLFGSEGTEPLDSVGPTVSFVAPAADAVVTGNAVPVEVTATDTLGVASIEVHTDTATPIVLVDTDPSPERFTAMLDTLGLPDGPLRLIATARDADDNMTEATRSIVTDNFAAGTISGIAVKGRVGGATVSIYTYANGVRGLPPVGTGTTAADGSFTNVLIAEGTSGALVVEVGGGGTYIEEAFPNPTTTLDVNDKLRTIVPAFIDGGAASGVVVTPLTAIATTYFDFLTDAPPVATVAADWMAATTAIEAQFGVANIRDIVPLEPAQMTVLTAAARYGLVLVGLSRIAWQASTAGGGDAGSFGPSSNAQKVVNAWLRDIADGCWDGKENALTQLTYGGTQAFGDQATRLDLAQAIVAYLADVAHNPTPFVSASDVLGLLDTLASGGSNAAVGSCVMTTPETVSGHVFDDNGDTFDQAAPTIAFRGATPADAAFVKATITVDALASDPNNIDIRPTLVFDLPMNTVDVDGDPTDRDALAMINTLARPDGALIVTLSSEDDSGNVGTATRSFTVDNTAPVIAINSPATANGYYQPPVIIDYTVNETNLASASSTVNGSPMVVVTADGPHTLVVTATDRAMTTVTATRSFTIDSIDPVLNVTAPANGSFVQGPVTISWVVNEANPGTSIATLDGDPIPNPHTFDDEGPHLLVVNASDAAGNPAIAVMRTFTIDNTRPVITVSGVTNGVSYDSSDVTITYSASDTYDLAPVASATLNNVNRPSGSSVSAQGAYVLVVNAVDRAGNTAIPVTISFMIDRTDPMLSLTSQVPGGPYVKGTLVITVTGDDNLATDGSLGPNITVSAMQGATLVFPSLVHPVISGGRRQIIATFPQATLADGPLAVRFNLIDRAGNAAATLPVDVTVDNTAPTIPVLRVDGFVETTMPSSIYWTTAPFPTVTGTVTEANLGAIVRAFNGVTPIGTGTVTGTVTGSWSVMLTLAVPQNTGFDVTFRVDDAAGNLSPTITRHFTRDVTGPTVTSEETTFFDERADVIDFPSSPRHAHGTSGMFPARTLGGDTMLPCPVVAKYAYLTATTPQGAEQPESNPVQFDWSMIDSSGVGVDPATVKYTVTHVPSAIAHQFDVVPVGGGGGVFNLTNVLLRDGGQAIPELGAVGQVREGRFDIQVLAKDLLGNQTTLVRCFDYQPMGVPVFVTSGVAAGSGVDALTSLTLPGNGAISPLLNSVHPGAGLMRTTVQNLTSDPVFLTFSPTTGSRMYSEQWRFFYTPVGPEQATVSNCGSRPDPDSPPTLTGLCTGVLAGTVSTEQHALTSYTQAPRMSVRVWVGLTPSGPSLTPCVGCSVNESPNNTYPAVYPPDFEHQISGNTTYTVVTGTKDLFDPRFLSVSSGYGEGSALAYVDGSTSPATATFSYTGIPTTVPLTPAGDGNDTTCVNLTWIDAPGTPDPDDQIARCVRKQQFAAIRYLSSVSVAQDTVSLAARSSPSATMSLSHAAVLILKPAPNLLSVTWSTSEIAP